MWGPSYSSRAGTLALQGLISASTRLFRPIPLSLPVGRFWPGLPLQTGLQPYFQASCPFLSPLAPPIRRSYRPSPTRCLHIWSIHRSFLYPLLVLLFSALLSRTRYFSVAEEPHYYYILMKSAHGLCTGEIRVLHHALAGGLGPKICGYSHRPIRGSESMHACMRTHACSRAYACACKISLPPLRRCCNLRRGHLGQ